MNMIQKIKTLSIDDNTALFAGKINEIIDHLNSQEEEEEDYYNNEVLESYKNVWSWIIIISLMVLIGTLLMINF